jgi:hypothetical protein
MPKPFPKTETEIVMSVDRDAGVIDDGSGRISECRQDL